MGFGSYLANGFKALALKDDAIHANANDSGVVKNGVILVSILSILGGIVVALLAMVYSAMAYNSPELTSVSIGWGFIIGVVLVWLITLLAVITHFFATLLGGNSGFLRYWATLASVSFAIGIAQIPIILLSLIPLLGTLISLAFTVLSIVVSVRVVRAVYAISTGRASLATILPIVVVIIIVAVIAVMAYFSLLSPAGLLPA